MKKILFYIIAFAFILSSCRKDDEVATYQEPEDINVQNSYDDQAIQKYLNEHYLDDLGNIIAFDSTDSSDDNETSLANLNPITLPSGVIYIVRDGAQPTSGTTIGTSDIIRFMNNTQTYLATESEGEVKFISGFTLENTIAGTGTPTVDPLYYYTPQTRIDEYNNDKGTSYTKSFFEIEGLREGLQHFEAFDMDDSDNYNLQGIIIVPSRAAFARDSHFPYNTNNWRNRTFIFNFQVYKTTPRT